MRKRRNFDRAVGNGTSDQPFLDFSLTSPQTCSTMKIKFLGVVVLYSRIFTAGPAERVKGSQGESPLIFMDWT